MKTELPEMPPPFPPRGWVLYDGQCPLCIASVLRWQPAFGPRGFGFAPLQTSWVRQRLGLRQGEVPPEMKLLRPDGGVVGGPDVLAELGRSAWWSWPFAVASRWPVLRWPVDRAYRWFAANRRCLGDVCRLPAHARPRHHAATTFLETP